MSTAEERDAMMDLENAMSDLLSAAQLLASKRPAFGVRALEAEMLVVALLKDVRKATRRS